MITSAKPGLPNLLPNSSFMVGLTGWQVTEALASGSTWAVEGHELVVRSAGVPHTASGTLTVYSPRAATSGVAGTWTGGLRVRTSVPALVDLSVVLDAPLDIYKTIPALPPLVVACNPKGIQVATSREIPAEAVAVGLRLSAPAGVDLVVESGWLRGPGLVDTMTGSAVGAVVPDRGDFDRGALVALGDTFEITVLVSGRASLLRIEVEDTYRGGNRLVHQGPAVDTTLRLPTDQVGSFRAHLVLSDGTAERDAEVRYAVDVDSSAVQPDASQPWALTSNLLNAPRSASLLRLMGIPHTRFYLGCSPWDLPAVDRINDPSVARALRSVLALMGSASGSRAGLAARRGAQEVQVVDGWPDFTLASSFLADATDDDLLLDSRVFDAFLGISLVLQTGETEPREHWARLVQAVARDLKAHDITWSTRNEPDLGAKTEPVALYVAAEKLLAATVRATDPQSRVVGPVIADGWDGKHQGLRGWDWLVEWAQAGGLARVDAVSVHLHMLEEESLAPERESFESLLLRLRRLVDDLGGQDTPLWCTEMGWRSNGPTVSGFGRGEQGPHVSEADQADLLVRAMLLGAATGLERLYAFHLHGLREFGQGARFDWGVVTEATGGPKPAFLALRTLARVTAGRGRAVRLTTAERVRAVAFDGVAVVWQWSGGPGLWRLDPLPLGASITDLMGAVVDGSDLRRPVIVHGDLSWLEDRLRERFP